jgi:hypothetical protein
VEKPSLCGKKKAVSDLYRCHLLLAEWLWRSVCVCVCMPFLHGFDKPKEEIYMKNFSFAKKCTIIFPFI